MIVVSDTSPLSCLIKTQNLFLLQKVFGEVVVPLSVYKETLELKTFGYDLREFENAVWLKVNSPQTKEIAEIKDLDEGEADAIALAIELKADLVLIDERNGFDAARKLGLVVTGLLGVVIEAKEQKLIPSGKQLIDQFRSEGGMWIGPKLYEQVIKLLNE